VDARLARRRGHRTYEVGLNQAAFEQVNPRFAKLHGYRERRKRSLVVIDEAMPQVFEARLTPGLLTWLKGQIAEYTLDHRRAVYALANIEMLLRTGPATADVAKAFRALTKCGPSWRTRVGFT
jgi:hypothetical protein